MTNVPRYRITPGVSAAIDDIERQRIIVDSMLLVPEHEAWTRREVVAERATSTTRIEGIGTEPAGSPEIARAVARANENAVRAYEFVDYLSDLPEIPVDDLVVRQINREFLRGEPTILTPGVYRRGQNAVGRFAPPDQGDVPQLMRELVAWIRSLEDSPIIAAALAHIHFVAIHPFWDGNGRTARALSLLVLQRSAFGFRKLLSVERQLLESKSQYFAAIERTLGQRFEPDYDATAWLEFFAPALAAEAVAVGERLTGWRDRLVAIDAASRSARLSERQRRALAVVADGRVFTRADYMAASGASAVTASRDLRGLVEAGLLVAEGFARTRTYRASEGISAYRR